MSIKMQKKKINFNEKWEEFNLHGISVLSKFLREDFQKLDQIEEVKDVKVFTNKDFIGLYNIIYNLWVVPKGNYPKTLYSKYVEVNTVYLNENVLPNLSDVTGTILLKKLAMHWDQHVNIWTKWLGKCFNYLNQHFVKQNSLETVSQKAESLFKTQVFMSIKLNVYKSIMEEFEKERDGDVIDTHSLQQTIEMIIKFRENKENDEEDFYKELEDMYTKETALYYNIRGVQYLKEYTWEEYLTKVLKIIDYERERAVRYMKQSQIEKFIAIIQDELLSKNLTSLLDKPSGLNYILENHITSHMKLLYRLYSPLQNPLKEIAHRFKAFVTKKGNRLVDLLEDHVSEFEQATVIHKITDSKFVEDIMSFTEKYLWTSKRFKDTYFITAFQSAFASFLNRTVRTHTIAEILGRSVEKVLRKGNQDHTEVQISEFIETITDIFTYMEDKDLFIEVYRSGLAKRLLDNKIASLEYEKEFIGRIKMSWGPQYTSKVEGMLSDTNSEAELVREFLNSPLVDDIELKFDVKVLTDGHWPSIKSPPITLPQEIYHWMDTFNKFYVKKNKMKHLVWSYMYGSCHLHSKLGSKEYSLILSVYQTSILYLFNDHEELSFNDIKDFLKIDETLLKKKLSSLCTKRYKILSKSGNSKNLSPEDVFKVNEKFKSKLKVISVPIPILKETFNKERVDIDRTHAIDAAIVKIMKSRKTMTYMHLMNEVMTLLQVFKPTSVMIKNRIESLIDRDYMERDVEDNQVFKYLA